MTNNKNVLDLSAAVKNRAVELLIFNRVNRAINYFNRTLTS